MRPRQACWFGLSAAVCVVASACGGHSVNKDGDRAGCVSDSDCPHGQTCRVASHPLEPATLPPCGRSPPTNTCPTDGCGPGAYCQADSCGAECRLDCSNENANPCAEGTVCRTSGACEPLTCADTGHPGCPTGMTCGIGADGTWAQFPSSLYGTDQDTGTGLTDRQTNAIAQGCVFLACDRSGAFDCAEDFRCDAAHATGHTDATGCVGIPCTEGATCAAPEFVCAPNSAHPHITTKDDHGCTLSNCDEGHVCPPSSTCDFTRPGDDRGCAWLRCDEPGGSCPTDRKCDPNLPPLPNNGTDLPYSSGCVFKTCWGDGIVCPSGSVCAPMSSLALLNGCYTPPPAITGGVGGTSASGVGGTSASGGTGGVGGGNNGVGGAGATSGATAAGGTTSVTGGTGGSMPGDSGGGTRDTGGEAAPFGVCE